MPSSSGNFSYIPSSLNSITLPPNPFEVDIRYTPLHVAHERQVRAGREHGSQEINAQELDIFQPCAHPQRETASLDTSGPQKRASKEDATVSDSDGESSDSPTAPLLGQPGAQGQDEEISMGKRKASPRTKNVVTNGHAAEAANGHASDGRAKSTNMESSLLGHRRRHSVLDSPTSASGAVHLMSRSNFSLDEDVPDILSHEKDGNSRGFTDLPEQDKKNFLLLVLLYFLQGVPMGLAMGSVPFLLKKHVSYAQMGVFSLASYPYSLKLLWSPIVDAVWSPNVGRRKSWILPVQTMSGLSMLWLAGRVEALMAHAAENDGANVWGFTWWWFGLVFMCATQDIAVDGWALTLLSPENLSYASTAQTVGLTAGQFLSSTIFLAFNSAEFANKWFRSSPGETGLISLSGALSAAGWLYLIVTVGLAVAKKEELTKNDEGVWDVYKVMFGILRLKHVQTLIIVHLIAKIGFQANDGATMMKLLDKGFGQDNLSLTVLIDFPFEIGLGYYVGKYSSIYGPMQLWSLAFVGRIGAALVGQFIVWVFPSNGVSFGYLMLVIFGHVYSTFMNTVMFVAVSAFHAKIADPVYGGTYMTLLATVSNLGGTFPKYFILKFIDAFTVATCVPPTSIPPDLKGDPVISPFSCVLEPDKTRCSAGGGTCNTTTDGYYIVNILCVIVGLLTFYAYIKPAVKRLEALPVRSWRLVA
ncbi:uncharacterized protein PV09_01850 [Verruconis gallopava]|uniref:Acetyl-coenzyme A transporter 1 n=1 Tax=Verruconis gallopava TaxID=253628 RepID=A0A0D1Z4R4_9PEZI|nr:uncharacterized protein PV09_01850 [Verruconis gallopava]KIW07947.1 hypothetical protein PV09_01850 [Verruconis gallopava]